MWAHRAHRINLYDKDGLEVENTELSPEDYNAICDILGLEERY